MRINLGGENCSARLRDRMPTDELKFEIQEKPSWRAGSGARTSSQLLKEIVGWKEKFDKLSQKDRESFEESFTLCMNIEYVYHSNLAEGVGLQTYEGIKQSLERILGLGGRAGGEKDRYEKETVNTAKAFMHLRRLHQGMGNTAKLHIDEVRTIHQLLMNELRTDAGNLRTTDSHLRLPDNSFHFYCKPEIAQAKTHSLIAQHNIHMATFHMGAKQWNLADQFSVIIKSAAWLLSHFMEIHPFSDGNGRMGWLLANYVLSLLNPFPTHLYEFNGTPSEKRQAQFLEALQTFRKNPKEGPRDIAALIVEGMWTGWQKFYKAFEMRQVASDTISVVIQKSNLGDLEQRVSEMNIAKNLGITESEAVTMVREMVGRVNVATFQPQQYSQLKLESKSSLSVYVRVFP